MTIKTLRWGWAGLVLAIVALCPSAALAANEPEVQVGAAPVRYAFVSGDAEKFQAHNWINEGYAGGLSSFAYKQTREDGTVLEMEGYALGPEDDREFELKLEKEKFGYLHIEHQEFTKYFDGTGGVYHRFTNFTPEDRLEIERDLQLDIGKVEVEAGLTLENMPEFIFFYEHEYKEGVKSRLSWGGVTERGVRRNISPSWQEVDETVDVFGLRIRSKLLGFDVEGEQSFEFVEADTARYEKFESDDASQANKKARLQVPELDVDTMTTHLDAKKWYNDDKNFIGFQYRYFHLNNDEVEDFFEYDEHGVIFNMNTNPHQIRNAVAHNDYDSHTWVANHLMTPMDHLNIITKVKAEITNKVGASNYPADNLPTYPSAPDGIINRTEDSRTEDKVDRFGEAIAIRYNGIDRVSLYAEGELEQTRNVLNETRFSWGLSPSSSEFFDRETITDIWRTVAAFGARFSPADPWDITTQYRFVETLNNYNDVYESVASSGARSAFFESLNVMTNEVEAKVAYKPSKFFRPSVRYQYRHDLYETGIEVEDYVESDVFAHIVTLDVSSQPTDKLWCSGGVMYNIARVETPAAESVKLMTPDFASDSTSFYANSDYTINDKTTLNGNFFYTTADNFDAFTSGLPYGADFDKYEASVGLKWQARKNLAVEPQYAFYHYDTNEQVEYGDYDAHVILVKFDVDWA